MGVGEAMFQQVLFWRSSAHVSLQVRDMHAFRFAMRQARGMLAVYRNTFDV